MCSRGRSKFMMPRVPRAKERRPSAAQGPRSIPSPAMNQREESTQGQGNQGDCQFFQAAFFSCASAKALAFTR